MTLIEEIKDEIKKAHTPKVPEQTEEKPEKKRRQKTKEEIAAYIARKQAEEERRYLKLKEGKGESVRPDPVPKERKKKAWKTEIHSKKERQKTAKKQKGSCSKARPKTIKTIGLPDGGSLLIIYMPGHP